tara:strand:+ start:5880 stop:6227 length:348 start_codon:yes stop_codon:yes gene_type:complete
VLRGSEAIEKLERVEQGRPAGNIADAVVKMSHPADPLFPDGRQETSLIPLGQIRAKLALGWKIEDAEPTAPTADSFNIRDKTVPELREFAEENGFDISGLRKKADIIAELEDQLG